MNFVGGWDYLSFNLEKNFPFRGNLPSSEAVGSGARPHGTLFSPLQYSDSVPDALRCRLYVGERPGRTEGWHKAIDLFPVTLVAI